MAASAPKTVALGFDVAAQYLKEMAHHREQRR
jgi:hypothetical protein